MKEKDFQILLEEKGISLSPKKLEQFDTYYKLLLQWNKNVNLTAITAQDEVYEKHFYDSISPAFYINLNEIQSICDIGAGAGFPTIPLKICFPHLQITIVDSLNKRITFLEALVKALNLGSVHLFHARAEEFGRQKDHRESYDIVTARAVARMSVLSELCLPLVRKGGHFVALKGAHASDEWKNGEKAVSILGGELEKEHTFKLPFEEHNRSIFVIKKVGNTPLKYPRKPGLPNKQPLE